MAFLLSVYFVILLLPSCHFDEFKLGSNYISTQGIDLGMFSAQSSTISQEILLFRFWSAQSWLVHQRWSDEVIVPVLLSPKAILVTIFVPGITVNVMKRRRYKCPCAYYANTTARFHALLEGDLVFKLNPGPTNRQIDSIVTTHCRPQRMLSTCARNSSNLVNIRCEPCTVDVNYPLSLCLMNTQSIRNKTADFVDYVSGNKFDLVAVTET